MSNMTSEELKYARIKLLIELAEKNKWDITPAVFLKAVEGSKKLLLNILWLARRSNYVSVEQVRDGRSIKFWTIKVTGKIPAAPAITVSPLMPPRGRKTAKTIAPKLIKKQPKIDMAAAKIGKLKAAEPVAKIKSAVGEDKRRIKKAAKTVEQIKAENLKKMKEVSLKKKKIVKTDVDLMIEDLFKPTDDIITSFAVDPAWDSMENVQVANFLR